MNIENELKALKESYFLTEFWREEGGWFVEVDSDQGALLLYLLGFRVAKTLSGGVSGNGRLVMGLK